MASPPGERDDLNTRLHCVMVPPCCLVWGSRFVVAREYMYCIHLAGLLVVLGSIMDQLQTCKQRHLLQYQRWYYDLLWLVLKDSRVWCHRPLNLSIPLLRIDARAHSVARQ